MTRSDGLLSAVNVLLGVVVLCEVALKVSHWLMQLEPRFLHILQRGSDGEASDFPPFAFAATVRAFSHLALLHGALGVHSGVDIHFRAYAGETCSVVLYAFEQHPCYSEFCTVHVLSRPRVLSRQNLHVVTTGPRYC